MLNTGDNPEAPAPREMIDLEVYRERLNFICDRHHQSGTLYKQYNLFIFLIKADGTNLATSSFVCVHCFDICFG